MGGNSLLLSSVNKQKYCILLCYFLLITAPVRVFPTVLRGGLLLSSCQYFNCPVCVLRGANAILTVCFLAPALLAAGIASLVL